MKYVEDLPADEIETEIKEQFPDSRVELFQRDEAFTGTVKVIFKDEEQLNKAMRDRCKIKEVYYLVDVFNPKPRVIKCNTCQAFGHVSRLCRRKNKPVCGKCCGTNHETNACIVEEEGYKCAHCGGNHVTGSYTCQKMKEKLDEIISRRNV